jgi:hypothetical protein
MKEHKLLRVLITSFILIFVSFWNICQVFQTYALEPKVSLNEPLNYLDFLCNEQETFKSLCEEAGIKIDKDFDVDKALHLVEVT